MIFTQILYNYISGSNLILERVMVKKGIPDNMDFLSFDSEANLCRAKYVSQISETSVVCSKSIEYFCGTRGGAIN